MQDVDCEVVARSLDDIDEYLYEGLTRLDAWATLLEIDRQQISRDMLANGVIGGGIQNHKFFEYGLHAQHRDVAVHYAAYLQVPLELLLEPAL